MYINFDLFNSKMSHSEAAAIVPPYSGGSQKQEEAALQGFVKGTKKMFALHVWPLIAINGLTLTALINIC